MRRQQKSCRFNGKELDEETGLYYFGARYYNPRYSLWYGTDPLQEKYPWVSSYCYTMGNPVNAIDYEGEITIFINGQHGGTGGTSAYWNGLDIRVMNVTGDRNVLYFDGAMGGWKQTFSSKKSNLMIKNRFEAGQIMGYKNAKKIFSSLSDGETIKLVTHSMGVATAKGFIEGLYEYAKENKIDMKGKIAFEFDLAPFQPSEQKSSHGVKTIALHHYFDRIAGIKDLPGADNYIERREVPVGKRNILSLSIQEHGVDSFGQEEIKKYIDKFSDK